MSSYPDYFASLQAIRGRYPAVFPGTLEGTSLCVMMLDEFCRVWQAEGWGLLSKADGNTGLQPVTGLSCSVDWLFHFPSGRAFDALKDAPSRMTGAAGTAETQWNDEGEPYPLTRWVAPSGAPDPPDPPSDDLEARVQALEDDVATLHVALAVLASQLSDERIAREGADAALSARLAALEVPTGAGAEWGDPTYVSLSRKQVTTALVGPTVTLVGKIGKPPDK